MFRAAHLFNLVHKGVSAKPWNTSWVLFLGAAAIATTRFDHLQELFVPAHLAAPRRVQPAMGSDVMGYQCSCCSECCQRKSIHGCHDDPLAFRVAFVVLWVRVYRSRRRLQGGGLFSEAGPAQHHNVEAVLSIHRLLVSILCHHACILVCSACLLYTSPSPRD